MKPPGSKRHVSGNPRHRLVLIGSRLSFSEPKQKLQLILSDGSGPEAVQSKRILSPAELSQQLERLLLEDMATDEQIFDWVEVGPVGAVCRQVAVGLAGVFGAQLPS